MRKCSSTYKPYIGIAYIVATYIKRPYGAVCSMVKESSTTFVSSGSMCERCYFGYEELKEFLRFVDYLDYKYNDLGYKVHLSCNISISK